jgi:hypothetical protein
MQVSFFRINFYFNRPSKNCVKKIRNEDVKKNLRVAVGLNFLVGVFDF